MLGHIENRHGKAGRTVWVAASIVLLAWILTPAEAAERGDLQQGQRLYGRYCAVCHGIEGTGAGRNAPYLEQLGRAPRDHTDMWYMNRLSDTELYQAISEGKRREGEPPFMPWWGYTLTEHDIWDLVAFIRSLARASEE
jgi:mono/diheme cytochrome c family protein